MRKYVPALAVLLLCAVFLPAGALADVLFFDDASGGDSATYWGTSGMYSGGILNTSGFPQNSHYGGNASAPYSGYLFYNDGFDNQQITNFTLSCEFYDPNDGQIDFNPYVSCGLGTGTGYEALALWVTDDYNYSVWDGTFYSYQLTGVERTAGWHNFTMFVEKNESSNTTSTAYFFIDGTLVGNSADLGVFVNSVIGTNGADYVGVTGTFSFGSNVAAYDNIKLEMDTQYPVFAPPGPTPITGCTAITTPGEYVLANDIVVDGDVDASVQLYGYCIWIDGVTGVTIDGNGYNITDTANAQSYAGIGIYNSADIHLRNITVGPGWYGNELYAGGSTYEDMTFLTPAWWGYESTSGSNGTIIVRNSYMTTENIPYNEVPCEYNGATGRPGPDDFQFLNNTCVQSTPHSNIFHVIASGTVSSFIMDGNVLEATQSATSPAGALYWQTGNASYFQFTNNFVNESGHDYSLALETSSISGNTWANLSGTGFSETCTNDGFGVCTTQYAMFTSPANVFDTAPVALTAYVPPPRYEITRTEVFLNLTIDDNNGTHFLDQSSYGNDVAFNSLNITSGGLDGSLLASAWYPNAYVAQTEYLPNKPSVINDFTLCFDYQQIAGNPSFEFFMTDYANGGIGVYDYGGGSMSWYFEDPQGDWIEVVYDNIFVNGDMHQYCLDYTYDGTPSSITFYKDNVSLTPASTGSSGTFDEFDMAQVGWTNLFDNGGVDTEWAVDNIVFATDLAPPDYLNVTYRYHMEGNANADPSGPTYTASIGNWYGGVDGQAFRNIGTAAGYLTSATPFGLSSTNFAYGGWFYLTNLTASQYLFHFRADMDARVDLFNGNVNFFSYSGGPHTLSGAISGENQWHHVMVSYNGTHKVLWVDGVMSQVAFTGVPGAGTGSNKMGSDYTGAGGYLINGRIDEVFVNAGAIGDAQAQALYAQYNPNNSTVSFVNFDGATTNFTVIEDGLDTPVLEKNGVFDIVWTGTDLSFVGADFDTYVLWGADWVSVDSANLPADVNGTANLTFQAVPGYVNPFLKRDGVRCDDCTLLSYAGGEAVFEVPHFSNYTFSNGSNPTVLDAAVRPVAVQNLSLFADKPLVGAGFRTEEGGFRWIPAYNQYMVEYVSGNCQTPPTELRISYYANGTSIVNVTDVTGSGPWVFTVPAVYMQQGTEYLIEAHGAGHSGVCETNFGGPVDFHPKVFDAGNVSGYLTTSNTNRHGWQVYNVTFAADAAAVWNKTTSKVLVSWNDDAQNTSAVRTISFLNGTTLATTQTQSALVQVASLPVSTALQLNVSVDDDGLFGENVTSVIGVSKLTAVADRAYVYSTVNTAVDASFSISRYHGWTVRGVSGQEMVVGNVTVGASATVCVVYNTTGLAGSSCSAQNVTPVIAAVGGVCQLDVVVPSGQEYTVYQGVSPLASWNAPYSNTVTFPINSTYGDVLYSRQFVPGGTPGVDCYSSGAGPGEYILPSIQMGLPAKEAVTPSGDKFYVSKQKLIEWVPASGGAGTTQYDVLVDEGAGNVSGGTGLTGTSVLYNFTAETYDGRVYVRVNDDFFTEEYVASAVPYQTKLPVSISNLMVLDNVSLTGQPFWNKTTENVLVNWSDNGVDTVANVTYGANSVADANVTEFTLQTNDFSVGETLVTVTVTETWGAEVSQDFESLAVNVSKLSSVANVQPSGEQFYVPKLKNVTWDAASGGVGATLYDVIVDDDGTNRTLVTDGAVAYYETTFTNETMNGLVYVRSKDDFFTEEYVLNAAPFQTKSPVQITNFTVFSSDLLTGQPFWNATTEFVVVQWSDNGVNDVDNVTWSGGNMYDTDVPDFYIETNTFSVGQSVITLNVSETWGSEYSSDVATETVNVSKLFAPTGLAPTGTVTTTVFNVTWNAPVVDPVTEFVNTISLGNIGSGSIYRGVIWKATEDDVMLKKATLNVIGGSKCYVYNESGALLMETAFNATGGLHCDFNMPAMKDAQYWIMIGADGASYDYRYRNAGAPYPTPGAFSEIVNGGYILGGVPQVTGYTAIVDVYAERVPSAGVGAVLYDAVLERVTNTTLATDTANLYAQANVSSEGASRSYVRAQDDYFTTEYALQDFTIAIDIAVTSDVCAGLTYPNEEDLPSLAVIPVNFTTTYALGFTAPVVNVSVKKGGQTFYADACSATIISPTERDYNCTVPMHYFYTPGNYDLNVTVTDGVDTTSSVTSEVCTYGQLLASKYVTVSTTFPTAGPGINNSQSSSAIQVKNTGNVELNLSMKGFDLNGRTTPAFKLNASSFKAGETLPAAATLQHNASVGLNATVAPANTSSLWLWLSMPSNQYVQEYYSAVPWQVVTSS